MNIYRLRSQVLKKSLFVVLLVLLVFQSFALSGLAAPASVPFNFQQGGNLQTLSCVPSTTPIIFGETPTFCNIQIVLMIDDSGSMGSNDRQTPPNGGLRNQGAINVVNLLATKYYLPAVQLIDKLNSENPDHQLQYPTVQVAVIHFTKQVKNTNIQWMTIAPANDDEWTNDPNHSKKAIYDAIDLEYAKLFESTSFIEPFNTAKQLFQGPPPNGDCTRRAIMLFTDGAPEKAAVPLTGKELDNHMLQVGKITNEIQANQPADQKVEIYVTGFNKIQSYVDYWKAKVKPLWWKNVIGVDQTEGEKESEPKHIELLEGNDYLIQLVRRMADIIGKVAGFQTTTVDASKPVDVPQHLQTLRFTLYHLNPKATLEITDPNGQVIAADAPNVTVSEADSAIEAWDLENPVPGKYQVKATLTGGQITELLTYQNLAVQFNTDLLQLQKSVPSLITFKLIDNSNKVVLSTDNPKLDLNVSVTLNDQTTPLSWTLNGDAYQVSWTPPDVGEGQFNVDAKLISDKGLNLLNCTGATPLAVSLPITITPTITSTPVTVTPPNLVIDAAIPACVLPGKNITVPMRLLYDGTDRSWASTIQWNVSAKTMPDGKDLQASISTVNANNGDYQVAIEPHGAKEIQLIVTGDAEINGQPVTVSGNKIITICESPAPPIPIWLIFIWLLMGLFILLLGWVILRDGEINIRVWMLVAVEVVLVVIWFVLFSDYWIYLLWMLLLLAILLLYLFLVYRKEIKEINSWWLIIVLTLFISVWFVVFGDFPLWLILLLLLMWLGILVVVSIFSRDESPQMPWWLLVLLLILALVGIIYFGAYWISLLLWLLVTLVLIVVVRVIGPIGPPVIVYVYSDYFTLVEGIGADVEKILNENGIHTFKELAKADPVTIKGWLKEHGFPFNTMDPATWPKQAKLAEEAKKSGDWTEFIDLVHELRIGRERNKSKNKEKGTKKSPPEKRKKPEGGKKPPNKPK